VNFSPNIVFNSSHSPTIGVEVELQTIDSNTFRPIPGSPKLLDFYGDTMWLKKELLDSIVEVNTTICNNVSEVRNDLSKKIRDVIKTSNSMNMDILSMGIHPLMNWKDANIAQEERYLSFLDRMQWVLKNFIITGLHVHVGVDSGEKAIAITNGLTRYIPHLIAVSASSAFHDGQITGLASTRTKIFEALPTAGIPHRLLNFSEFQKYMRTLQRANTIESIREVWWDFRPHIGFGTVEIRICDSVPTLEEMVQIAAFSQCLVVALSDHYDSATQLPLLDRWILAENKWRATRYGLDAEIIIDDSGKQETLKDSFNKLIEILIPVSIRLGCNKELENLINIVNNNKAPYIRQLKTFKDSNSLNQVIEESIKELKESLNEY